MADLKKCNKCSLSKDVLDFNKDSKSKDKLRYDCRKCQSISRKSVATSSYNKKYKEEHKVENSIRKRNWYVKNIEEQRIYAREYASRNRKKRCYSQLKRKVKIKQSTIGNFDNEIKQIYLNRPDNYHVDHIVPLQGKEVCGLHVPWNLQYLTKENNLRKSNKLCLILE